MIQRHLGQGLSVSALSFGAMGYGKARELPDRSEMLALIRHAVESGMGFFDKPTWTKSSRQTLLSLALATRMR